MLIESLKGEEAEQLRSTFKTRMNHSEIYKKLENGELLVFDTFDSRLQSALYYRYRRKQKRGYHTIRLNGKWHVWLDEKTDSV